jgi:iron complex outermembrane receptor protein
VLKDASATAIYGSRGANGVVLVQTKRGARGSSTLEYDTYVAALERGAAPRLPHRRRVPHVRAAAGRAGNLPRASSRSTARRTRLGGRAAAHGYATNHNLAFSGGSQQTNYRASLNYFDQQGIVIATASSATRAAQRPHVGDRRQINSTPT